MVSVFENNNVFKNYISTEILKVSLSLSYKVYTILLVNIVMKKTTSQGWRGGQDAIFILKSSVENVCFFNLMCLILRVF